MYYPNIRSMRLKRDYKQEYVADVLSISQPEYSKLENGKRSPSATDLKQLAQLYTVTVESLLETAEKPGDIRTVEVQRSRELVPRDMVDSLMSNYTHLMNNYLDQQARQQQVMDTILAMKFKN